MTRNKPGALRMGGLGGLLHLVNGKAKFQLPLLSQLPAVKGQLDAAAMRREKGKKIWMKQGLFGQGGQRKGHLAAGTKRIYSSR